ncbi:MAG: iron ABC transporter permease [Actinobacteria bacterium]|nr:iron ABC transporter permease [Actinomycetota bacterium]
MNRRGRLNLLQIVPLLIAGLTLLPVVVVASSLLTPSVEVWRHLWDTILPGMLRNTLLLVLGVGVGTAVLGTGLAWLVTAYHFPGRRAFQWMLVLPMAVPAYIMGFIYIATFDFAGPVQSLLRDIGLAALVFPDIRSGWGAIVVMTLVLYPYVYLLAKAGFEEQSATAIEAARALGASKSRIFFKVALPLARPSIAAGVSLALMEAVADFATVRYFNFPTISDGILRTWTGLMDIGAASELAGLLAILMLALLLAERRLRSRRAYHQSKGRTQSSDAVQLLGWRKAAAFLTCVVVLIAAFGIPAGQLSIWAVGEAAEMTSSEVRTYVELGANSLTLAGLAAAVSVGLALVMAGMARLQKGRLVQWASRSVNVGYSIPGAVIAVGVIIPLAAFDRTINEWTQAWWGVSPGLILTGSLVGLTYAYAVRFMAIAYSSVDSSMDKISPNIVSAARSLGAGPLRSIVRIKLPLILPGLLAGATLVFVDVMKELPITVMLRPFGYDTLAIWVWQMAAESLWSAAALPALAIVVAGLLPIKLLIGLGKPEGRKESST